MPIASQGVQTTNNPAATGASYEVIAPTTKSVSVLEMSLSVIATVSVEFGIGRPAAIGVGPTSPSLFQVDDPADAAVLTKSALAWQTASPTLPVNNEYLRRQGFIALIGYGVLWTFPGGIVVPANGSLVVYTFVTSAAPNVQLNIDTVIYE